ncbi:MAG: hypothetical protein AB7C98_09300 [Acidithiobacillus sp.]
MHCVQVAHFPPAFLHRPSCPSGRSSCVMDDLNIPTELGQHGQRRAMLESGVRARYNWLE